MHEIEIFMSAATGEVKDNECGGVENVHHNLNEYGDQHPEMRLGNEGTTESRSNPDGKIDKQKREQRQDVSLNQLFECSRRHESFCLPRTPRRRSAAESKRSGGTGTAIVPKRSLGIQDEVYFQLVRGVLEDMVTRFRSGAS